MLQVTLGLAKLHSLNILHRDLKVSIFSYRALMFFSVKMEYLNSVIWMSPKSQKMAYYTLRQEPLIMQVHRYGKISLMIQNLTYGVWDA